MSQQLVITARHAAVVLAAVGLAASSGAQDAPTSAETAAEQPAQLDKLVAFVLGKLDYDQSYFERVLDFKRQGRKMPGIPDSKFAGEVQRAQDNVSVLRRYAEEKPGYREGKPFSLPKNQAAHREYTNLLALLDMIQAHQRDDAAGVLATGDRIVVTQREDLGRVRGADAQYYIALYRTYFFLMAAANYQLGDDARAVEWFARLEAHADLKDLKHAIQTASSEQQAKQRRLDELRVRPVAVMPFANHTGDSERDWVQGGLSEVLTTDLVQGTDLVVVERAQLEKVANEMALSLAGFVEDSRAQDLGKLVGAGTLLLGATQREGERLILNMRLVDNDDGRVLAAASSPWTDETLFPAARGTVLKLLEEMGWNDAALADEFIARHIPKITDVRALQRARLKAASSPDEARQLYAAAIKSDPALANLYRDLKAEFADVTATVAVLPFTNMSGVEADAWMARGVQDALGTDLPKLDFTVVERDRLDRVLEERALGGGGAVDEGTVKSLGALLSADFLVLGSLLHHGKTLRIDARFVDTRTGVIVLATSAEDRNDDLLAAIKALTATIAAQFNNPMDRQTIDSLLASKMTPEQFEKGVRARLAEDGARRRQRKEARTEAVEASKPLPWPVWLASGGVAVGTAVAAAGFVSGVASGMQASELNGMQLLVVNAESKDALRDDRNDAALKANVLNGIGVGGVVIALGSVGYLIYNSLFAGDDDEVAPAATTPEPPVATASVAAR